MTDVTTLVQAREVILNDFQKAPDGVAARFIIDNNTNVLWLYCVNEKGRTEDQYPLLSQTQISPIGAFDLIYKETVYPMLKEIFGA